MPKRMSSDERRAEHRVFMERLEKENGPRLQLFERCRDLIRGAEDWMKDLERSEGELLPDQMYRSGNLKAIAATIPILVNKVGEWKKAIQVATMVAVSPTTDTEGDQS